MLLNKRLPIKYIIGKIKYDLLYVLFFSLLVFFVSQRYSEWLPDIQMPIPAFIGTAISILLSFKLSQSYDRWWEARKIWGSIVNDSRTFVIQIKNFVHPGNDNIIKKMAYRQIAWCYSLGQSLRKQDPLENTGELLSEDEYKALSHHNNKPLGMVNFHAKDIAQLNRDDQLEKFSQIQIDNTLVRLVDSMGRAERIKSTVFPVTYRLFLHFTIYFFIAILTISLRDFQVYFQTPLTLLISSVFLLLEKSARHMQDPFENRHTDTAVTTIARTIDINIRQLLDEKETPSPVVADKGFYVL
jgi:ion channel-forming bestrophin family protein